MKKHLLVSLLIISLISVMMLAGCGGSSGGNEITLNLSFGDRTGTYTGEVNDDGLPDGQGTFRTVNESGESWTYTGTFVNGHFEGEGRTEWANGYKEIGIYHDDMIQPEPAENVSKMYRNPDEYEGHYFEITGQVFNIIGSSDGQLQFQIYQDVENYENNTLVVSDDVKVSENDYVRLTGTVQGVEEYENMLGGTTQAVVFFADSVETLDYKDAVMPTLKEVSVNKSSEQYGYKVTVEKVEFAEKETRVYVKVENGGSDTLDIYSYGAIAVQNGKQFEHSDNWDADYPEIQSDLRVGNSTEGVLVFNGLEQNDFTLIIEGYSENWDENLDDFEISIEVE